MPSMHFSTSKKAKVQNICDFLDQKGVPYHHTDVFKYAGVGKTQGWKILRQPRDVEPRTFHSLYTET